MLEKLKALMEESNKRPVDVAKYIGIGTNTFANWFSRGNAPAKYAPIIADYFSKELGRNITEGYLLGSKEDQKKVRLVPVVGNASCGVPEIDVMQDFSKKATYNGESWKESLYCVIANGDSMSPEIDDGDEVIIDPDISPINGDIVHYKINNESAIKVLVIDTDANILQFIPYNATEHFKTKTIRLDDEDTMNDLTMSKVISVNKLKFNNRLARLKMIGR